VAKTWFHHARPEEYIGYSNILLLLLLLLFKT